MGVLDDNRFNEFSDEFSMRRWIAPHEFATSYALRECSGRHSRKTRASEIMMAV